VEGTGRWRKFLNEEFKFVHLHYILSSRTNGGGCEWWACNVDGVIRIVYISDRKTFNFNFNFNPLNFEAQKRA